MTSQRLLAIMPALRTAWRRCHRLAAACSVILAATICLATLYAQTAPVDSGAADPGAAVEADIATPPARVDSMIAGTFNDASGHSAQSHLVYAANAGVWWLFTLSSAHDSLADHTVRSYYSSGPDLASATWAAAAPSPHLANVGGATNAVFAGGRSLGAAVVSSGGADYAHVFASTAFDGQMPSNGHIRARLGSTAITWEKWHNPGSPNSASEWMGPLNAGNPPSAASAHSSWGDVVGVSSGGFIHHSSVTMDQEVDCNAARSTTADIAVSWTNGFGSNRVGASPPNSTAVIDKSMIFQCKSLAFAPLASDVMLAVYSNGAAPQPQLTNLRFQRSGANGTWTSIGTSGGGNGNVFPTAATVDANDWTLIPVSTAAIYAFRRGASGTGVDGAKYLPAANGWTPISPAPPLFTTGQKPRSGGGLFGATDGTNLWLFCINSDAASSVLYTRFSGAAWTPWTTVPGTGSGTQTRGFISGYPRAAGRQIGLIWTEGTTNFDVMTAALSTDTTIPDVSMTAPADGATVSGTSIIVSAAASDNDGIIGVQFKLDGVNLGAELTSSPYNMAWNASAAANGIHTLTAVARDPANNTATATAITVTVNGDRTPPTVSLTAPTSATTVVSGATVTVSAVAADDVGVIGVEFLVDGSPLGAELTKPPYTATWDTTTASKSAHALAARARDAANHQTVSASVTVTVAEPAAVDTIAPTLTATPKPGTFTAAQSVALAASEPAAIYYTVDGSAPAASSSRYAAPIAIAATTTVRYLAVDPSGNSSTGSLLYAINSAAPGPLPPALHVNFQPASAPVPAGYLIDSGLVYRDRGNGQSYGWNADNSAQMRERDSSQSPDQRYDTLAYMQRTPNPDAFWEIAVPNGTYVVHAVAGDAAYFDTSYRILVEGVVTVNGTSTSRSRWVEGTSTITVSDGRITIRNASGATGNKICFVDITPQPPASIRVNFQPSSSSAPAGYLKDSGLGYGNRGNGQSYGWNADNSPQMRDRNSPLSPDQRYDTLAYMQRAPNSDAVWEILVPNGKYLTRVVAGDPDFVDVIYRIAVEGVVTVNGTSRSASRWVEGSAAVTVSDGRLTIRSAAGATANRICFVEITPQ